MLVEDFPKVEQNHLRRLKRMCHEGEHGGGSPEGAIRAHVHISNTGLDLLQWIQWIFSSGYKPRFAQSLRFSYKFSSS